MDNVLTRSGDSSPDTLIPGLLGVVLAGGRSSRMGRDKASLPLPDGGSLLGRGLATLGLFCPRLAVSLRRPPGTELPEGVEVILDRTPEIGPLGGLYSVLSRASELGFSGVAALACDVPLVTPALYGLLLESWRTREPGKLVTAFSDGRGWLHPLIGVWDTEALPAVAEAVRNERLSLRRVLPPEAWYAVPCPGGLENGLLNVNTREEYERAMSLYALDMGRMV